MNACAIVPGTTTVRMVSRPEPDITRDDEVKVRVLSVGICGTDREEAAGGRALAPEGHPELVLGHEMVGEVVAVGRAVARVGVGDHAVFTVRRGCAECVPCQSNRSDMCLTGRYKERGIWGLDGYQTEYVVDGEQYIVRVPKEVADVAVLTEPLSVAEKAVDEAVRVQTARIPSRAASSANWLAGKRCLVAGLGPIGLLGAMVLRLHGASVVGLDIVDPGSPRAAWLTAIGGTYVDGRKVTPDKVGETCGLADLVLEATGIASLEFTLLDALAPDGVYVLTGIPGGDRAFPLAGAELIRRLVLGNQVMLGSVNAAPDHFALAVGDLARARDCWPEQVPRLITHRHPYTDLATALAQHPVDEIKTVIDWAPVSHHAS